MLIGRKQEFSKEIASSVIQFSYRSGYLLSRARSVFEFVYLKTWGFGRCFEVWRSTTAWVPPEWKTLPYVR